ncbi:MAG: MarR family winged helix-turn-helix transcriptional regulator [Chitinispirillaceae bacterium]
MMDESNTESMGVLVSMIHRLGSVFLNDALAGWNVGAGQHAFLLALADNEGITQDGLAKIFRVDKATVARGLSKLESQGYVVRVSDPRDRRSYLIEVTQKGKELCPEIRSILDTWENHLTCGLSGTEKEQFRKLLFRVARNAGERV